MYCLGGSLCATYMTRKKRGLVEKSFIICAQFKNNKTFEMFFCANVVVYECSTRTIYCRPFTTLKNLYFPSLIGVKFGVCLDKSLEGFFSVISINYGLLSYTLLQFSLKIRVAFICLLNRLRQSVFSVFRFNYGVKKSGFLSVVIYILLFSH